MMFLAIESRHRRPQMIVRAEWIRCRTGRKTGLEGYSTQYSARGQHSGVALALPSPWVTR